ncbi:MAG TPA: phospholipid carrier-dependent glycosyltransferase [Candidatus Baltobacteraceae bacterium]
MKTIARPLWLILIVGLIARLLFIGSDGFHNDVQAFQSWSLTLAEHGFGQFYAKAGFADYPPGYFYILGAIGWLWETFFKHADPNYFALRLMVKIPAILADLAVGLLLYKLVRRFADERWALGAAALYVLNPVFILISAMWGQVDSISGGIALLAVYLLLRSDDETVRAPWFVGSAWVLFGYSLLIKPQAAILIPLFLAFAFVDANKREMRLRATAAGIGASLIVTLLLTLPFHPTWNPVADFGWLAGQYRVGVSQYPYGTINAFNLWAIKQKFWQSDMLPTLFFPQAVWAWALTAGAAALILWRYVQTKTAQAFVESAALLLVAFFMLASRMHERYIFDGLLFTIAAIPLARRYLWAALIFSVVTWLNLQYSLQYMAALEQHLSVDAQDLWGWVSHALALVNVATFFVLGYLFLGVDASDASDAQVAAQPSGAAGKPRTAARPVESAAIGRRWFDPREGLVGMRSWIDWAIAGGLGVVSFVLSYVNYNAIGEKIFDEIYFARAGEEYLSKNLPIYENTHPPLTKLLVTLSMMLFGGLHGGDNATGWRFLDVVFGALVIVLLYVFAKRITGSVVFATIATSFFLFDGMHFVQSRIATPEGFVVFFSLAAVYAFYRFWIAAQANVRKASPPAQEWAAVVAGVVSLAIGGGIGLFLTMTAYHRSAFGPVSIYAVFGLAVSLVIASGLYLLARLLILPKVYPAEGDEVSYPDGSHASRAAGAVVLETPDGGVLDSASKTPRLGLLTRSKDGGLIYTDEDLQIAYARDLTTTYTTPEGTGTFVPGVVSAGDAAQRGKDARFWLVAFTIALGMLVASKWYGVMGFGVSFIVVIGVWLQRYLTGRRAALWGNPRGFRLDVAIATILFVAGTVYALAWIPDLHRGVDIKDAADVMNRQVSMYEYHHNLVATHPYASKPWAWPIDLRPVAYYYHDFRKGAAAANQAACCVSEVLSLPNPLVMWFGLLCVPFVGFLAWTKRNKGYALIVLTYLVQWLPWFLSPRIAFAYHFYVDLPLICICDAIVLQWLWNRFKDDPAGRWAAGAGIAVFTLAVAGAFAFFYPILAGTHVTWDAWHARMWLDRWVI